MEVGIFAMYEYKKEEGTAFYSSALAQLHLY